MFGRRISDQPKEVSCVFSVQPIDWFYSIIPDEFKLAVVEFEGEGTVLLQLKDLSASYRSGRSSYLALKRVGDVVEYAYTGKVACVDMISVIDNKGMRMPRLPGKNRPHNWHEFLTNDPIEAVTLLRSSQHLGQDIGRLRVQLNGVSVHDFTIPDNLYEVELDGRVLKVVPSEYAVTCLEEVNKRAVYRISYMEKDHFYSVDYPMIVKHGFSGTIGFKDLFGVSSEFDLNGFSITKVRYDSNTWSINYPSYYKEDLGKPKMVAFGEKIPYKP